jgi:ribosomal silencing factor RsfS
MDYEDVVVHVFLEPVRQFYDLEGLWVDAPRINLAKGVNIGEERIESEKGNR